MKMKRIGRRWAAAAMALAAGLMTAGAVEPVLDNLPGAPGQSRAYWEAVRAEAAAKKAAAAAKAASTATATAETARAGGDFFTGKPYDADLGGYVFKYRTYDPHLGRWTTPDPSGFPDGANGYAYAIAPLVEFDPLGLRLDKCVWVVAINPATDEGWEFRTVKSLQKIFRGKLEGLDQTAPEGKSDHYIDDGDWFDFGSIGSASDLFAFSPIYDRIYLAAHADPNTGNYYVGGNWYSESSLKAITSKLYDVNGCAEEEVDWQAICDPFEESTRTFLRE